MRIKIPQQRIRIPPILFFCLAFSIYLLSYQGIPVSDDEQLFASAAQSLVNHGRLEAPQLYGNERVQGNYRGSGPVHSLLAAVVIRVAQMASLGQLQAVYFLSPFYTALTGAILVYMVLKAGYPLRTGLIVGVLFCLGTIAWPYSQTFFREPLAMLLLVLSWACLTLAMDNEEASKRKKGLAWAGFGIAYLAALLTKVLLITILPAYLVILWRFWFTESSSKRSLIWRTVFISAGIVVLVTAIIWMMNNIRPLDINTRLTLNFFERIWQHRRGYPYHEIPGALLGMLFSPTKGLFLYSPCVILAFIPYKKSTMFEKRGTIFAVLALSGLLLGQATAYGSEWWNTTWGTRFLLPVLPFLILAGLPIIERILVSTSRWGKILMEVLIAGSILIQLGGVLVSNATYVTDLYIDKEVPDIGLIIWMPQYAPLIQNWRLFFSEGPDLAAWNVFLFSPILVSICLILCFAILAGSFLLIGAFMRSQELKRGRHYLILLLIMECLLIPFLMLTAYKQDFQYAAWRLDILAAENHLTENGEEGDVILVYPYLGGDWYYFINFYSGELPWYSLPTTFPSGGGEATTDLIRALSPSYDRIWLLAESAPPEPMHTYALQTLASFGLLQDDIMWEVYSTPERIRLSLVEIWK